MTQDLGQTSEQPEEQETEEQPDPIALLAERLGMIEAALGVGNSKPSDSNLLNRLTTIEQAIAKPQRERALPKQITWSQLGSRKFLLANKIDLADISSGLIEVVKD